MLDTFESYLNHRLSMFNYAHCVQHHNINMILNYRGCLCQCSTTMSAGKRVEGVWKFG